jgi:hypothetical protein
VFLVLTFKFWYWFLCVLGLNLHLSFQYLYFVAFMPAIGASPFGNPLQMMISVVKMPQVFF